MHCEDVGQTENRCGEKVKFFPMSKQESEISSEKGSHCIIFDKLEIDVGKKKGSFPYGENKRKVLSSVKAGVHLHYSPGICLAHCAVSFQLFKR